MQRHVAHIRRVDVKGLLDHGVALGFIELGLDACGQRVKFCVAVVAEIPLALRSRGRGHHGEEDVVGIVAGR